MRNFFANIRDIMQNALRENVRGVLRFLLVLILGFFLVRISARIFARAMARTRLKGATGHFLTSLVCVLLYVGYAVVLLSMIGVDTTSLVAVFGVLTLAISLAVQGVVSNLASGFLLVATKPFDEGDFVDIDGTTGTVEEIKIVCTKLKTPDNKVVVVPNSTVTGAVVTNYSAGGTRRLDLTLSVAYGTELADVKQAVLAVIAEQGDRVLGEPAPTVRLKEMGNSSLEFTVRLWVNGADYWPLNFDLQEEIYAEFNKQGIEIPFPQMDVHIKQ